MEFLKQNRRFSFLYGGKDAWDQTYETEQTVHDAEVTTVYRFADGLTVTNIAKKHLPYGAYEWVNYLENTGSQATQLISELWDCDCYLSCVHEETFQPTPWSPNIKQNMFVLNPNGSTTIDEFDFASRIDDGGLRHQNFLFANHKQHDYQSIGGRSSDGNAPFFNIHQNGQGYITAIGWTGQWNCRISRLSDSVHLQSKIEDTCFILLPGEKIRTSSVVILPYTGTLETSQNLWRRMIRDIFSPTRARIGQSPFCASLWGGTASSDIIKRIDTIEKNQIPFEYIWLDAGWCGKDTRPTSNEFEGDWADHVGDWEISPSVHPNGLLDVSEKIKKAGKKFILWFEPERVRKTTHFAMNHPEFLLSSPAISIKAKKNFLMNLGNETAFDYCAKLLCDMIERLGVDCYRQDFNIEPLTFWRANDAENRRGITEIKYVMGLYRLWDLLLERFPNLIIDNCASGGKRIDMETIRRSFPFWRSDAQCPADPNPEITQIHNVNFSMWIPFSGTSSGRLYDTYCMRSAYSPIMTTNYSYSSFEHFGSEPAQVEWLRERCNEYLRIRRFFDGNLYCLTKPTKDETAWCVTQWHLPQSEEGMIQVFKREQSPYSNAIFHLKEIKPTKRYRFTDIDGDAWEIDGKILCENGLSLDIKDQRVAKIYLYQLIS